MVQRMEGERNLEDNGVFASLWKNCNVVQDWCFMRVGLMQSNSSGIFVTFVKGIYTQWPLSCWEFLLLVCLPWFLFAHPAGGRTQHTFPRQHCMQDTAGHTDHPREKPLPFTGTTYQHKQHLGEEEYKQPDEVFQLMEIGSLLVKHMHSPFLIHKHADVSRLKC